MALSDLDRPTFPPAQLKDREMAELYGFDGSNWRRVQVDASGAVVVSGGGGGALPNRADFATDQKTVAVPGTGEQLQAQAVPNGFTIFVEALSTNKGNVYLSNSKANAENHAKANILDAGAFRTLALTDVSKIWIDADVAGEGVQWTVEI